MSIVAWIIVGLVSGLLAGQIMHRRGRVFDMVLGVFGAFLGGWFSTSVGDIADMGATRFTHLSVWGVLGAIVGAAIVLMSSRAILRQTTT